MNRRTKPRGRAALIAVLGLAGVLTAAGIAMGGPPAPPTVVTGGGELSPSTLPKKRHAPASLTVRIRVATTNPTGIPDPVTNVLLNFDDDGKVTTKGLPVCRRNLENTTTEVARRRCRSSFIGRGRARALIPGSPEPLVTNAVVSLFNGPKRGKKPTVLLHNRSTDLGITVVLTGVIRNSTHGRDFDDALDVRVPPLPAGAVFSRIKTTVERTWRFRGKRRSYISARCHDGNRKLNVHGEFEVSIGGQTQTQTGDVVQTCRVKR
jgi:hypothetical protein